MLRNPSYRHSYWLCLIHHAFKWSLVITFEAHCALISSGVSKSMIDHLSTDKVGHFKQVFFNLSINIRVLCKLFVFFFLLYLNARIVIDIFNQWVEVNHSLAFLSLVLLTGHFKRIPTMLYVWIPICIFRSFLYVDCISLLTLHKVRLTYFLVLPLQFFHFAFHLCKITYFLFLR